MQLAEKSIHLKSALQLKDGSCQTANSSPFDYFSTQLPSKLYSPISKLYSLVLYEMLYSDNLIGLIAKTKLGNSVCYYGWKKSKRKNSNSKFSENTCCNWQLLHSWKIALRHTIQLQDFLPCDERGTQFLSFFKSTFLFTTSPI